MSISHKFCMVPSIMLDIIDQVDLHGLVLTRDRGIIPTIFEDLVIVHQFKFQAGSIHPLCVSVLFVQHHSMDVVPWNLMPILVLVSGMERSKLCWLGSI